ncbi:MAG: ThiF family adenylyltransferase [Candidatus Pacebacteria bacterium]|nr:ThiF family adenylyltransferase [Candidatus Paceibacterota bacterium]
MEIYEKERLTRHLGILTQEQQSVIEAAVVCGAGAGGAGGWAYAALARMGCRNFKLADPGVFDESNANRQYGCYHDTVGKNKAVAVAEELSRITPLAKIQVFEDGVTSGTMSEFLATGSVVIDGIDLYSLHSKKALYDSARLANLPVFSSPVLGFGTAVAVFDPQRSPSFEEYFGPIPETRESVAYRRYVEHLGMGYFGFRPRLNWPLYMRRVHEGCVPSIGTSCMLSGSFVAMAVSDWLLGTRNFPVVPHTSHIDLMQRKLVRTGRFRRALLNLLSGLYLRWIDRDTSAGGSAS